MSEFLRARGRLLDRGLITFDATGELVLTRKGREEMADFELLRAVAEGPATRVDAPRERDEDSAGGAGRRAPETRRL